IGRAAVASLAGWLSARDGNPPVRLSYHPENTAAAGLYTSLGFRPTGLMEDDELIAELTTPPPTTPSR
ncbi:GNAT family N-acetyltransferase, partial [Micromonospora sp. 15K316]|uniref:GNAT family N-acetyltransferase n=1 Tax=Micromonospora sp. 15K316 TaxID=2530376 RepID=UPI0010E72385